MTTNDNHDGLAQDLVKQSMLTLEDNHFQDATMKKILKAHRRRVFFDNLFLGTFIFLTVDTLIVMACWMLHINFMTLVLKLVNFPARFSSQTVVVKNISLHDGMIQYGLLAIVGLVILIAFIESRLDVFGRKNNY